MTQETGDSISRNLANLVRNTAGSHALWPNVKSILGFPFAAIQLYIAMPVLSDAIFNTSLAENSMDALELHAPQLYRALLHITDVCIGKTPRDENGAILLSIASGIIGLTFLVSGHWALMDIEKSKASN